MTTHRIRFPAPHPKQREIEACQARRVVVCAGRRFGKTTMLARLAAKAACKGRRVLYLSPIMSQSDAFWERLRGWLGPAIAAGDIQVNETLRRMTFLSSEGVIRCRTAHDPDSLRGDTGDFILLDEFAQMDPQVWVQVVAPMTLDADAPVWFVSTPTPGGPFKAVWLQSQADPEGRWGVFHATSLDNPHLSAEALAALAADMSEADYDQEILAKFVPGEGTVFTNIEACLYTPGDEEHEEHRILVTIDWGQVKDYTSISVGCADCQKELELHRWRGVRYPEQQRRIAELVERMKPEGMWAEANAMGLPNIQALQEAGVSVVPFDTTADSKRQIIQGLKLALERGTWKFVEDKAAKAELEAYEVRLSGQTGQPVYGAPAGMNDDTVISRALLVWAASHGRITMM